MPSDTSIVYTPRSEGSQSIRVIRPPSLSLTDLAGHVKSLTRYAGLIYTLSEHRIRVRYKQSMLGVTWAIVQPLALMVIYTVIFSFVAHIQTNGIPYPIFVFAGSFHGLTSRRLSPRARARWSVIAISSRRCTFPARSFH